MAEQAGTIEMPAGAVPLDHPEMAVGVHAPEIPGVGGVRKGALDVQGASSLGHRMKYTLGFEWLDADVLLIENAFAFAPEDFVALADRKGGWRGATVVGPEGDAHYNKAHRDTEEFALWGEHDPDFLLYEAGAVLAINAAAQVYRSANPFAVVQHASRCSVLRYGPGQFFGLHVDTVNRDQGHLGSRILSFVGFLNAVEEGGVLEFPRQGIKVIPAPGRAVMFPSGFTHPHVSHPVVKGTKRAVVSWMH